MSNVSSNSKKAGGATPASVQAAVQTNQVRKATMNNATVKQLRVAFNNGDVATMAAAHHSQLMAAIKGDAGREALHTMFSEAGYEPPKWVAKYEKRYEARLATAVARQPVHHVPMTRRIIESTVDAREFAPMLLGKVKPTDWADDINARQAIITKSGREISAAANAIWKSQFEMTKLAMALKAAVDLRGMNLVEATRVANAVHDKIENIVTGYAAQRGINHRELVMAEVTIATKHGCFDSPDSDERYWEEQLVEAGLGWDEIAEVEHERELEKQSRQNELVHRKDATAEDEGRISTALHEFGQLAELDAKDIEFAEGSYAQVAFMDQNWPKDDPMWPDMVDRLENAWAASIEWAAEGVEQEEAANKAERRDKVVQDFHCRPYMTRWVLNHVTRRAWRDITWLGIKRKEFAERIDRIVQDKYLNERYQVPVGGNRRRDEGADNSRVINLLYREVAEADIKATHQYMLTTEHTFDGLNGASVTAQKHINVFEEEGETEQADAELRFWGAVIDEIDDIVPGLKRLYGKLRAMEDETAVLWEMFARDGMPDQPPIYWNRALSDKQLLDNPGSRNYYLTEEEATAALHREIKEQGVKMRLKDGDALSRAMAALNDNFGLDI